MKYLALFLIFLFQAAHAEEPAPWRIAIIGDTHDSPKRMEGSEGVAVNFIKTLYGEILKHQVDMVVQVGDMADIEGSAPVNGLAKRKELNKMLEEKGIPFYAVRLKGKNVKIFYAIARQSTLCYTGCRKPDR